MQMGSIPCASTTDSSENRRLRGFPRVTEIGAATIALSGTIRTSTDEEEDGACSDVCLSAPSERSTLMCVSSAYKYAVDSIIIVLRELEDPPGNRAGTFVQQRPSTVAGIRVSHLRL